MFENVKKKLYFARLPLEIKRGLDKGLIVPFEDELYARLDNIYFCGTTLSIRLKYLRPLNGMPGECEDRSLFIKCRSRGRDFSLC